MYKIVHVAIILLAVFICVASSAVSETYRIELNRNDFSIADFDVYSKIEGKSAFITQAAGFPELPMLGYKYYLPPDAHVTGIRIINAKKERITGLFDIYPAQKPQLSPEEVLSFTPPDSTAYASSSPFPAKPAQFAYSGFMRGHQLADVAVYPFEYVPAKKELYFYSSIEFEFVTEGYITNPPVMMNDASTIDNIKRLVQNRLDVSTASMAAASKMSPFKGESIPMVIITKALGVPKDRSTPGAAFSEYASYKKRLGINAEVKTVSWIYEHYDGLTDPERIRNFIIDRYLNNSTQWVLMGGDVDIVPAAYLQAFHQNTLSDLYYSCLDGTWDNDGDGLLGETTLYGDTVDYYPDIYVGRIPCRTYDEAKVVLDKIKRYQMGNPAQNGYESKALLVSTSILSYNDGLDYTNALKDIISPYFSVTQYHNVDSPLIVNAMNSGNGLLVFYGHSGGPDVLLTRNVLGWWSGRQWLPSDYFDTMDTHGQYSIFLNSTCNANKLDTNETISRSFMLNPNGGGVGYIGSTTYEVSQCMVAFHKELFNELYNSRGSVPLGEALNYARLMVVPSADPYVQMMESYQRMGLFGYMLLGDPQLEAWIGAPRSLEVFPQAWQLTAEEPANLKFRVWGDKSIAAGVFVSLTFNGSYIAGDYTNDSGIVDLGDHIFNSPGYAIFLASKSGFYIKEDTIAILARGEGIHGDINLNGVANEIGDQILFVNYFLHGSSVFTTNREAQIEATDVNGDGEELSLADFVYLLRIVCGDIQPLPKPFPEMMPEFYFDGTSVHAKTSSDIGAALFIFEGEVQPTAGLAAEGMEIQHAHSDGTTRVLVYSMEKNRAIRSGEVLSLASQGKLISVDAATYDGAKLLIDQNFQLPIAFNLSQNYPNPFNSATKMSFSLPSHAKVNLSIFNILGQKVVELIDADYPPGEHEIIWDGTDSYGRPVSSGTYFAKIMVGDKSASKRIVIVK